MGANQILDVKTDEHDTQEQFNAVSVKNTDFNLKDVPFTKDDVYQASLQYFDGDTLAASTFQSKYALKRNIDGDFRYAEQTPHDMHDRLSREFARIESNYSNPVSNKEIREYLDHFKYIVPQGSPMYGVGNPYVRVSLSNCVVVQSPPDNVSGILETGKELANLFKRRCVEENTLVLTKEQGMIPMRDVTVGLHVLSFNTVSKIDEWRPILGKFASDVDESDRVIIKTANGSQIRTSAQHPILTFSEDGYVYRNAGNLLPNDIIITPARGERLAETPQDSAICDIAWWLGAHIGDGTADRLGKTTRIRMTGDNKLVLDKYAAIANNYTGSSSKVAHSRRKDYKTQCWDYCSRNQSLTKLFDTFFDGKTGSKVYTAKVPDYIRTTNAWWPFIAGLLDTDGTVKGGATLVVSLRAGHVIDEVSAFLASQGARYHVSIYPPRRANEKVEYRLSIHVDSEVYAKIYPWMVHDKKRLLLADARPRPYSKAPYFIADNEREAVLQSYDKRLVKTPGNLATIICSTRKPEFNGFGVGALNEFVTAGVMDEETSREVMQRTAVVSIEPDILATTYWDISVEHTNNFYAGNFGLINIHNCGVGLNISTLRADGAPVSNSAGTSTGAWSFADLYSFICRMIGQNGRRGALMITMDVRHPDIDKFILMKRDLSKVTGANISIMLTDDFMQAVENDDEWIARWPVETSEDVNLQGANVEEVLAGGGRWEHVPVGTVDNYYSDTYESDGVTNPQPRSQPNPIAFSCWISESNTERRTLRSFKARDLWYLINESAVKCAEPGLLFWDNYRKNLPANCYPDYKLICVNPCCFSQKQDVFVITKDGVKEIKNVTSNDLVWIDKDQVWAPTSGYFESGIADVYSVKFSNGEELQITSNHKLARVKPRRVGTRINKQDSELVQLSDLKIGDEISISRNEVVNGGWGTNGTFQQGVILGWLTGDGCFSYQDADDIHPTMFLSFWEDEYDLAPKMLGFVNNEFHSHLDLQTYNDGEGNDVLRVVSSTAFREMTESFETNMWRFKTGHNPFLDTVSRDFAKGYLASYFTADGHVENFPQQSRWSVRLGSVDKKRLHQVQRMLSLFGISSSVYLLHEERDCKIRNRVYRSSQIWRLTISGKTNIKLFEKHIGFLSDLKTSRLKDMIESFGKSDIEKCLNFAKITNIDFLGTEKVGCIEVPEYHSFTANCIISGNSEIGLSAYDSCRLLSENLKTFVIDAFTEEARFDYEKFDRVTRVAMRMMDDLVDLEIEALQSIIDNVSESDEKILWGKLLHAAKQGRRTGLGTHGLADALARLGLRYDSPEAVVEVDRIFATFRNSAYDESVNLSIERGAFPAFNWELEKDCEYIKRLPVELQERIAKYGRRNISLLTMAPTGSVSIESQTSSGLEPVFSNYYMRRKKINPSDTNTLVDFVDSSGDKWSHFEVYHHNVMEYLDANPESLSLWETAKSNTNPDKWADELGRQLPHAFVTASEIDPKRRVEIQGVIQKYIDHGISSTINMPKGTTIEQGQELYHLAWKNGLKGVTVYVEGSRQGVLVNIQKDPTAIQPSHAPKRPTVLPCEIHHTTINTEKWTILVGMLNGQPYEIFGGLAQNVVIPKKYTSGTIVKNKCEKANAKGRMSCYDLVIGEGDDAWTIKDIVVSFADGDYAWGTRAVSLMMRHGVPIHFIVEQLSRDIDSAFNSFSRVIARILKKYVVDGTESTEKCEKCGDRLVFEDGCHICKSCGYSSKCG